MERKTGSSTFGGMGANGMCPRVSLCRFDKDAFWRVLIYFWVYICFLFVYLRYKYFTCLELISQIMYLLVVPIIFVLFYLKL